MSKISTSTLSLQNTNLLRNVNFRQSFFFKFMNREESCLLVNSLSIEININIPYKYDVLYISLSTVKKPIQIPAFHKKKISFKILKRSIEKY